MKDNFVIFFTAMAIILIKIDSAKLKSKFSLSDNFEFSHFASTLSKGGSTPGKINIITLSI